MRRCWGHRLLTGIVVAGLVVAVAQACSVPVFRYALERWPADPYEVFVFHDGPLTPAQQAQVKLLRRDGLAGETFANVRVNTCDLADAEADPDLLQLWKAQDTDKLPWLVVHYPVASRNPTPVWKGEFSEARVRNLLDSPLRRQIADRLVKGHTAVWVLLESGQKEADDAAAAMLTKRCTHLEKTLKLPEISEEDIAQGLVLIDPEDLKLKFSLVRLSRKDPAEAMLVEMLLSSEKDLRELKGPMAFPLFGRGRALYALVGKGINTETIDQAGRDLTGPCTCTVKEQNPGIDMLMAVNWDELVQPMPEAEKPLPPLVGLTGFGDGPDDPPAADTAADPAAVTTADEGPLPEFTPDEDLGAAESLEALSPVPTTIKASVAPAPSTETGGRGWLFVPLALILAVVAFGSWYVVVCRR